MTSPLLDRMARALSKTLKMMSEYSYRATLNGDNDILRLLDEYELQKAAPQAGQEPARQEPLAAPLQEGNAAEPAVAVTLTDAQAIEREQLAEADSRNAATVSVPIEPTGAMISAGLREASLLIVSDISIEEIAKIYKAMLAAAPEQPVVFDYPASIKVAIHDLTCHDSKCEFRAWLIALNQPVNAAATQAGIPASKDGSVMATTPAPAAAPLPLTREQIDSAMWDVRVFEGQLCVTRGQEARHQALAAIDLRAEVERLNQLQKATQLDFETACKQVDELKKDAEDADESRERLARLLTRITNTLKGHPEEGLMHEWSDVPKLVFNVQEHNSALKQCAEQAERQLAEIRASMVATCELIASTGGTATHCVEAIRASSPTPPKRGLTDEQIRKIACKYVYPPDFGFIQDGVDKFQTAIREALRLAGKDSV